MQIQVTTTQMLINPNISRIEVIAMREGAILGSLSGYLFNNGPRVFEALSTLSDSADVNTLLLDNDSLEALERDGYDLKGNQFLALENLSIITNQFGTPDHAMIKFLAKSFKVGVISYVPDSEKDPISRFEYFGFEYFGDTGIMVFDPQKIDFRELQAHGS
jgi:hypothetical protein